jgi:hypothetical protein
MRAMQVAAAVSIIVVTASAPARGGEVDATIETLAKGGLTLEERGALINVLVKANAAPRIEAYVTAQRRSNAQVEPLLDALRITGTRESVDLLRKLVWNSRYLGSDVLEWDGLVRKLARGEGVAATASQKYVYRRCAKLVQAAAKHLGKPEGIPEEIAARIVRQLNDVLSRRDFYKSFAAESPSLNEEGTRLLQRHDRFYEYTPGDSLESLGLERLNRYLLDFLLKGEVAPLVGIDVVYFDPDIAAMAFDAVGSMETADARELVLTAQPAAFAGRIRHVKAIAAMRQPEAVGLLADYLLDREPTVSFNAARSLSQRVKWDSPTISYALSDLASRIKMDGDEGIPDKSLQNVAAIAGALLSPYAEAAVESLLGSESKRLVLPVLKEVGRKPHLAADDDVLREMDKLSKRMDDVEVAKAILSIIKDAKLEEGVDIAARYLEHPNAGVQGAAAYTLRILTKRQLRTASQWRDAIASQPDVLYYDDVRVPTVRQKVIAIPATEAKERDVMSTSTKITLVVMGCIVALLGVGYYARTMGGAASKPSRSVYEARKTAREGLALKVVYKLMSHARDFVPSGPEEGKSMDLSAEGMKMQIKLPDTRHVSELRARHMFLGVQIFVPGDKDPVRAHAIAAWVRPVKDSKKDYLVGLKFQEITQKDKERLLSAVFSKSLA